MSDDNWPSVNDCRAMAIALRADGMTYRSIVRRMAEMSLMRPDGRPWSQDQIRTMVLHVEIRKPIHPTAVAENAKTSRPPTPAMSEADRAIVAEASARVLQLMADGMRKDAAAQAAGIGRHRFALWRKWSLAGREPYATSLAGLTAAAESGARVRESARESNVAEVRRKHADDRMRRYVHKFDPDRAGEIYILADRVSNRIKVGFASNLKDRLRTYYTHAPHLDLVVSFAGKFHHERNVHAALRGRAVLGREWYAAADLDRAKSTIAQVTGSEPSKMITRHHLRVR